MVLIPEGLAKSGRYFTRRAVEDVARLAAGARAFADHPTPTEDRERPVRSIRDVVGWYIGGRIGVRWRRGVARVEERVARKMADDREGAQMNPDLRAGSGFDGHGWDGGAGYVGGGGDGKDEFWECGAGGEWG